MRRDREEGVEALGAAIMNLDSLQHLALHLFLRVEVFRYRCRIRKGKY